MNTSPLDPATMCDSVWAVPPLARRDDGAIDADANRAIARHIEAGGISTLLYGGNAIFYHLTLGDYESALETISEVAGESTTVVPSLGPAFGTMLDQINVISPFEFPTAMILPQRDIVTSTGFARAVREVSDRLGRPVVLYLKYERMLSPSDVASLVDDGCISAIKWAVVRDDHTVDDELRELCEMVDPKLMLSGLGDQPALVHMDQFGLGGFTTGTGCVAPRMSATLLAAIRSGDHDRAEEIRQAFLPLEDLRNAWGPITVLHEAVQAAGIAATGPVTPLLCEPNDEQSEAIAAATQQVLQFERSMG